MDLTANSMVPAVAIRPYTLADAADTMEIFLAAVTETAAADYSPEQIQAWARPEMRQLPRWNTAMLQRNSYVAIVGGKTAGFSDLDQHGHIDMMFVAPRSQRLGVARSLLAYVESS